MSLLAAASCVGHVVACAHARARAADRPRRDAKGVYSDRGQATLFDQISTSD